MSTGPEDEIKDDSGSSRYHEETLLKLYGGGEGKHKQWHPDQLHEKVLVFIKEAGPVTSLQDSRRAANSLKDEHSQ
jgi:hypothetical protein